MWVVRKRSGQDRQHKRPKDPKDLNFELNYDHLPDNFVSADISVGDRRHLVMYTEPQLKLMKRTKRWYIDATFKIVKAPFMQLLSVHGFVKHGENYKQVPLAYALMSGRKKNDYRAVFHTLRKILEGSSSSSSDYKLQEVVMDFEAGMWGGIRLAFPEISIKGCVFHWVQAVWRHVQGMGLQEAYNKDEGTHTFLRRLMALPFVPHEHILRLFLRISSEAPDGRLKDICTYIHDTWISSNIWPPSSWSVFQQNIRTNNDVEGWHNKINRKAGRGQIQFYLLVELLYEESKYVEAQTRLVREEQLTRFQRLEYKRVNSAIQDLWERFNENELTSMQLLNSCAKIYGPAEDEEDNS